MPSFDYEQWWSLHLRVAKGEALSEQEQSKYDRGLNHIDSQDVPANDDSLVYLRTLRAAINRATIRRGNLAARSAELDRRIAELEAAYQQLTGQTLNLNPHASA